MDKISGTQINDNLTIFCGGQSGTWKVLSLHTIIGQPLESVNRIEIVNARQFTDTTNYKWLLRGVTSNLRYTTRDEKVILDKTPSILDKPQSTYSVLIPIKKSNEWWSLTQDERRKIFEDKSHHISFSSKYLSVVARKLYHSKDIGEEFDFLTWFEFAPEHSNQFDELVNYLRGTEEWKYVTREIDIRLMRDNSDK
ncbi:MAG: chlorite dismutase [Nanoarchaeota archaeon]|nr:MAG: chlorite dismutase [Nanoarchaeota archaeon]